MTLFDDTYKFSSNTDIMVSCYSRKLLIDVLSEANEIAHREYIASECEPYKVIVKHDKEQLTEALIIIENFDETVTSYQAYAIEIALKTALKLIQENYRRTFDKYVEAYASVSCMDFNVPF